MTPRFTPDDERGFVLLPKDNYPVKVDRVYPAEKPDGKGRTFYKVEVEVISKDYASVGVTVNMSEHWMKHLMIHIMRAVGMMVDMVVDPFFRDDPEDSASFKMATVMGNLTGCRVGIEIEHNPGQKDPEKTYHNVKDFYKLKKKDGSEISQPEWKEVAPVVEPSDDLEPDIELEDEDDDFLKDG